MNGGGVRGSSFVVVGGEGGISLVVLYRVSTTVVFTLLSSNFKFIGYPK